MIEDRRRWWRRFVVIRWSMTMVVYDVGWRSWRPMMAMSDDDMISDEDKWRWLKVMWWWMKMWRSVMTIEHVIDYDGDQWWGKNVPFLRRWVTAGHEIWSEVGLCPDLGPFVNEVGHGGSVKRSKTRLVCHCCIIYCFPSRLPCAFHLGYLGKRQQAKLD